MSFLDNIGKTITSVGQGAIQKSKEMADVAKYNLLIVEEEKKTNGIYELLGRKYVELKGDSNEEDFKEYLEALKLSKAKVEEYRNKLVELKRVTKCPACGAEVPNGSMFCSICGTKITLVEHETNENEVHCPSCGSVVPVGSKFCTACGKAIENNTIEEKGE